MIKLVAPLALLAFCSCEGMTARVQAGYMQTEVKGHVALAGSVEPNDTSNRRQDVQSDLGLNDGEGSLLARIELGLDKWRLRVSGFEHEQNGDDVLSRPFGDLAAGTPVDTRVKVHNVKVALNYDLVEVELGESSYLKLAPGVVGDYIKMDVDVDATTVMAFESVDTEVLAPMPDLLTEIGVGPFIGSFDAAAIYADLGDGTGLYWDFEAILTLQPFDHVEFFGGYRWIKTDIRGRTDGQEFKSDVDVEGWFVGGGIEFGAAPKEPAAIGLANRFR